MARTLLLLAALAAASSAQAEMLSAMDRYPAGPAIQLPGEGPWNIHIDFAYALQTVFGSIDIPVAMEDSGQAITIDESTIASYGGDWADVVTWSQGFISPGLGSNHSNGTVLMGYIHDPATRKGGSLVDDFLRGYPLPRAITEFTPLAVVVVPALSGNRGTVGVWLDADVTIVPEPITAPVALSLMGLCMRDFGARRRRPRLRQRHQ